MVERIFKNLYAKIKNFYLHVVCILISTNVNLEFWKINFPPPIGPNCLKRLSKLDSGELIRNKNFGLYVLIIPQRIFIDELVSKKITISLVLETTSFIRGEGSIVAITLPLNAGIIHEEFKSAIIKSL